jgi:hypothetical protein
MSDGEVNEYEMWNSDWFCPVVGGSDFSASRQPGFSARAAGGDGGTPWPILADMLSRTIRAPVCFRSATVNYLRVGEWLPGAGSKNIERLVERAQWFGPSGDRRLSDAGA